MDPQRWHRIGEIYHSALQQVEPERGTHVARACQGDIELQREVDSLLEADASSGDFLETGLFEIGLQILVDDDLRSVTVAGLDHEESDRLVGTLLDERYLIEKKLGHGGVGTVYLARDRKLLDKAVVVKVLLEKSLQNEWVVQKFHQEKEALARVDHPGVVGIVDTGELPNGNPYIVMQYVDGMSLRAAIKAKPEGMELDRVASIICQAGSALSAVHEKKIYHRDLKPENIMLQNLGRTEEQVKILDFGVAKVKESVIAPSTMTDVGTAGTIVYMSPEQLRGEKVTASSDIYSLAVITYELVTGRRPFTPDTAAHLAEMQRQGVRAKPSDLRPRLPERAEELILRSLSFDSALRHQNAAAFGDELAQALKDEAEATPEHPLSAKTIEARFEAARPQRSEQGTAPAAVAHQSSNWARFVLPVIVVAALVIGGWYLSANRQRLFGVGSKANPGGVVAERSLIYSLTVQKIRDGKAYQQPFQSSGQEIFENGYKFRLNLTSPQSGYLYVFNEGADVGTGMSFTIIYPTPSTNKGSGKLEPEQQMQTNWNTFGGQSGTEDFWIVWSASPIPELEAARDAAFRNEEGALTDAAMVRTIRQYLTKHADPKPQTVKDTMKQQTYVSASSELLVKLVELEHR